jgi:CheY-like chemotaxis protein
MKQRSKKAMNNKSVLVVSNKQVEGNALSEWTSIPHPFHINIVNNDEAAIELLHQLHFDMVVVDGTDSNIDGRKLHAVLPILQEDVTVLKYEGESAMELENYVKAIFNAKKYQRLQRMLMLEPAVQASWSLPAFSLN